MIRLAIMQIAMQIAIIALMSTFVYALVALGFTLVFGILRVVNFAHGEFYMLGAYAMYVFYGQFGWPYLPSIAAAAVLVGFLGLLAERGLFRRFVGDEMGGMIMSLALAITLQAGISLLFSVDEQSVRRPVEGAWQIGQAFFRQGSIADRRHECAGTGCLLFSDQAYPYRHDDTCGGAGPGSGTSARRQFLEDHGLHLCLELRPGRFVGCPDGAGLHRAPYMGEAVVVKAFIIVVLGGLGSLPGAVVAALILSVTEAVASTFYNATVATMLSFLIVMAVLLVKPSGLMGKSS